MTKEREPESKAVAAARAEVASVTRELGTLQRRLVAQVHALRLVAPAAEPIGILNGKRFTVEGSLADYLEALADDAYEESLGPTVEGFQRFSCMDYTKLARDDFADAQDDATEGRAS